MRDLVVHLEERVGEDPEAFVFTALRGGLLRHATLPQGIWRPAAEQVGLGHVTPHWLRHTAATLLIDAGASVKDVQRHLGHADAAVTLNIYSGVMEGRDEDLAERLERIRSIGEGERPGRE